VQLLPDAGKGEVAERGSGCGVAWGVGVNREFNGKGEMCEK
jgi:hypothetical protein